MGTSWLRVRGKLVQPPSARLAGIDNRAHVQVAAYIERSVPPRGFCAWISLYEVCIHRCILCDKRFGAHEGFVRRKLTQHTSCVNALAFSPDDGRWLASGGDGEFPTEVLVKGVPYFSADRQILLWDFHQDNLRYPSASFSGPRVGSDMKRVSAYSKTC